MSENDTPRTAPAVYEGLAAVMKAVSAVRKGDRNTHSNYNFRGIDAVMNAVGPALREHGVIVTPNVRDVQYEEQRTQQGKPSTSCRVLVDYIFYAVADGSTIVTTVAGEATDTGDKATPKAMSVAFRTALLQALCLPTDEPDPDSHTYEQQPIPAATKEQLDAIGGLLQQHGLLGEGMDAQRNALLSDATGRQTFGGDLTEPEATKVLELLRRKGPTAEQEKLLGDSLGARPVEQQSAKDQDGGQ